LDLYLYDINHVPIDASVGSTKFESLLIPQDGQYYVNVVAYAGASNYLLSVGLTPDTETAANSLRLSDDFIPGEVLARFDDLSLQARDRTPCWTGSGSTPIPTAAVYGASSCSHPRQRSLRAPGPISS
jgi:serine protease